MLFSSIASLGSVSSSSSVVIGNKSVAGSYGSNNIALNILATAKTNVNAGTKAVLDATASVTSDINANVNSTTSVSL